MDKNALEAATHAGNRPGLGDGLVWPGLAGGLHTGDNSLHKAAVYKKLTVLKTSAVTAQRGHDQVPILARGQRLVPDRTLVLDYRPG